MPFYNLLCPKGHAEEKVLSFHEYDRSAFGYCSRCRGELHASAANSVCVYGTTKFHDESLRDASEAAGRKITSAKEADKLESEGKMYRITNPSQYRRKIDKRTRDRVWKEKLGRVL